MEYDATSIDILVDDIRQALIERYDGEEDPEAKQYNEYLLDSVDLVDGYIRELEKIVHGMKNK